MEVLERLLDGVQKEMSKERRNKERAMVTDAPTPCKSLWRVSSQGEYERCSP